MNCLVDYGSSSSDSDEEPENDEKPVVETKTKLPKPALEGSQTSLNTSVFTNPFVQAELAKAAILEKHVKMVPGTEQMQTINGKKICWNFRKGRCRFGHNCKYAHDTDIQKTTEEMDAEKHKVNGIVCEGQGTVNAPNGPIPPTLGEDTNTDDVWEGGSNRKKKRPGLSQNLVPGKKVLDMYKKQKLNHKNNKSKS